MKEGGRGLTTSWNKSAIGGRNLFVDDPLFNQGGIRVHHAKDLRRGDCLFSCHIKKPKRYSLVSFVTLGLGLTTIGHLWREVLHRFHPDCRVWHFSTRSRVHKSKTLRCRCAKILVGALEKPAKERKVVKTCKIQCKYNVLGQNRV